MNTNSSVLNNYNYNGYSNISSTGDTVTVTTSSPSYNNPVYTIDSATTIGYPTELTTNIYQSEKRYNLRDNGKLPHDLWAKLFNKGVLHD